LGDSLPPPAEFDLVDSFARLRGSDAEIVLADPKTDLSGAGTLVRLEMGGQRVQAAAETPDSRLVVRVPRSRLSDGIWSIAVVRAGSDGGESVAPLAARLLVQGARPLVLLWGAKGGKSQAPTGRAGDVKQRLLRGGADALDRALTVLPPDRAAEVRRRIRSGARRVLG
jgi:hypothetical protein